ncbi:MAG: PqqD family protein [Bacteroidota bacterium]
MTVNFFQRRKILKKLNYMEATPIRKCNFETNEAGIVTLIVPKFKNEKFNTFFFHQRKRYFRIALDELGSTVWLQIDGIINVATICNKAEELLGEKIQPVHDRIPKFFTMLYEARYISFKEIEKESN